MSRQPARPDQAGVVLRAVHRDRGGRRGRGRRAGPRRGRRARDPGADARHDPRVLARPRALRGDLLVAVPGDVGPRRLGVASMPTASGTSTAAPTTRSRSPASGSGRPRSRVRPCRIRPSSRRRRSACRTRSRARSSSCCACCGRARRTTTPCAPRSARRVADQLGKPLKPEVVAVVRGAAQDPLGQGHAPGDPSRLARASTRATSPALDDPSTLEAIRAAAADAATARRAASVSLSMSPPLPQNATSSAGTTSTGSSRASPSRLARQRLRRACSRSPAAGSCPPGCSPIGLRIRNILVAAVEYYDDARPARPAPDLPPVPGRPAAARPARPRRRRGLGQRHDDPRGHRAHPPGRRHPDDGRAPLQAVALGRPGRARPPRGHDRRMGRLPVQGRRLKSRGDRSPDLADV